MTIAFISDLHLTPERPHSTEWFDNFMKNSVGLLEKIYILGDLFEIWIGDDGRDALGQSEVESILSEAAKNDIYLYFMHGNRDFLVGADFEKRTGCKILDDPSIISLGSTKVLLTHGDSSCTDDIEHQNARKEMVSSKWKVAFLGKSIDDRMEIALTFRKKSESAKKAKSMEIMDVNQTHIEKLMREYGVVTMIHGHTHKPTVHEFDLDGTPAIRYVLGDWYTQKSVLLYDNGSFTLKSG